MEETSILTNEEVLDKTEEITAHGSGKGIKIAAGIGLSVLAGVIVYRYVVKPIAAKIKAKKESQTVIDVESAEPEEIEDDE